MAVQYLAVSRVISQYDIRMLLPFISSLFLLASSIGEAQIIRPNKKADASVHATVNKKVLLQMVNNVRSKGCKCGTTYYAPAAPVEWNEQLEKAAVQHSTDMFKRNYFSHIGSDGTNGGMRIDQTGYKWVAYGENIASGYTSEKEAIESWILSPLHCKNMMDKAYKEMGVGRAGNYWTQDFASR